MHSGRASCTQRASSAGRTAMLDEITQRATTGGLLPSTIAANPTAIHFGDILDNNLMAHP